MAGIHWFRKGLRLHDNPALAETVASCTHVYPIYILDPNFTRQVVMKIGVNRWQHLIETLEDLDQNLRKHGLRLFVFRGQPEEVIPPLIKEWKVKVFSFESDTEPYAKKRDPMVVKLVEDAGVSVIKKPTHTLYDPAAVYKESKGNIPLTYQGMQAVLHKLGAPAKPIDAPDFSKLKKIDAKLLNAAQYNVFTLDEVGFEDHEPPNLLYPGGETEALRRLERSLKDGKWICQFEKPKTSPNSLEPSTTVLSPYLKFGSMSVRKFYWGLQEVYDRHKGKHSQPPVSLHGQLLWREFFYQVAAFNENFHKMKGNKVCRQIKWDSNPEHLKAWKEGRTGYPFIDAIMTKLRLEGWIHHLARHATACFLTRGDLFITWEEGEKVFEEYLLDADYSLNAGNWMWLSASAFFHQYFRIYSPITFGKKTDPNGDFIRKYVPALAKFPAKFIYEPWNAPLSVQKSCGCVIGDDYPKRIVDHEEARRANLQKMAKAFQENKKLSASERGTDELGDVLDEVPSKKKKR